MFYLENRVDTKFKVNDNVVVCIITTTLDLEYKLYKYGLITEQEIWKIYNEKRGKNNLTNKYVGVAKCGPEDVFDEAIGRKIAEYRASEKRMKDVNRQLDAYINEVNKKIADLTNHGYMKMSNKPKELKHEIN